MLFYKKKNILKLIKILSTKNIYSKKKLSYLSKIKKKKINYYIFILKKIGIKINTIKNKKYQLKKKIELINFNKISKNNKQGKIIFKPIIHSTNQYLIESIKNIKSGDICISEYQTKGRGRLGKRWFSPFGCNICLSIYWCFKKKIPSILSISLVIGIVIAETINKLTGSNIKIKWPNDLYINDKKLAGILVESIYDKKKISHVIIGIGINIIEPDNIKKKTKKNWISLEQSGFYIRKNKLIINIIPILKKTLKVFEKYGFVYFKKRWLKLDKLLNKKIKLHKNNHYEIGIYKGINEFGAFLFKKNGKIFHYFNKKISTYKN